MIFNPYEKNTSVMLANSIKVWHEMECPDSPPPI